MRRKRDRKEPESPVVKNRREAIASSHTRLGALVSEGVRLSILEAVYKGSYERLMMPEMALADLLGSFTQFTIHQSMVSPEESVQESKLLKACGQEKAPHGRNNSLVNLSLRPYQNFLAEHRGWLSMHFARLYLSIDREFSRHGGAELEQLRASVENFQTQFEKGVLSKFSPKIRDHFLSKLYTELFALHREYEIQMHGGEGIFKILFQVLRDEVPASEIIVLTEPLKAKASFLIFFINHLDRYQNSEEVEFEFKLKNFNIRAAFSEIYHNAEFILELLNAGGLPIYWKNTKAELEEELIVYQAMTWDQFRELDLLKATAQIDRNIKKLVFLKKFLNDGVTDVFLKKFQIMVVILNLQTNQVSRAKSVEILQQSIRSGGVSAGAGIQEFSTAVDKLIEDDNNLSAAQEEAQVFEAEAPFCREVLSELSNVFQASGQHISEIWPQLLRDFESELILEFNCMESMHHMLSSFLRGKKEPRTDLQLFAIEPVATSTACSKIVTWARQKIELIMLLMFAAQKMGELPSFLMRWEGFRLGLEELCERYKCLGELPEIARKQLSKAEIQTIQKNGAYLFYVDSTLKQLRPLYKELFQDTSHHYDIAKAEAALSETQKALEYLSHFTPINILQEAIEGMTSLQKEHKAFFCELYLPKLQREYEKVSEELRVYQENLEKYLEIAHVAQAIPDSPCKKTKTATDDPSSPPQVSF